MERWSRARDLPTRVPCSHSVIRADGCFRALGAGQKVEFDIVDADRLRTHGEVKESPLLVRLRAPPPEMRVFDDGLAVVKGTDETAARGLVTKWPGVQLPE